MPGRGRFALSLLSVFALLASMAWAGIFKPESAEDFGRILKRRPKEALAFVGAIVSRVSLPNPDPNMPDTFVTRLGIEGSSLTVGGPTTLIHAVFLGGAKDIYQTTAEPSYELTQVGKRIVVALEKGAPSAEWTLHGNRISGIVRNASGEEIAISESPGFWVNKNMKLADLRSRVLAGMSK